MRNNWFFKIKESLKIKRCYLNKVFFFGGLRGEVPHLVRGFTLLELLITIAIISIVMTAVVMVINPFETLSQARDGRRISEITSIDEAITLALQQDPTLFEGDSKTIYLSLPNIGGFSSSYLKTCADYPSLPPLVTPWKYNCVPQANLFKADGAGWVPMSFSNLAIRPLTSLPVDPVNDAEKGLYYNYVPGWEIDAQMESKKYEWGGADDRESVDGGNTIVLYEKGQNLNAAPPEVNARITYDVKVPDVCSDGITVGGNGEFYTRWNIPGSGKVVITRFWSKQPDNSFSSGETMEMMIYDDISFKRLSDASTFLSGTGAPGEWVSSSLPSPVAVTLGNTYIFGVGAGPYNIGYDAGANCTDYLPNGNGGTVVVSYFEGNPASSPLNSVVPVGTQIKNWHPEIIGVSYAEN